MHFIFGGSPNRFDSLHVSAVGLLANQVIDLIEDDGPSGFAGKEIRHTARLIEKYCRIDVILIKPSLSLSMCFFLCVSLSLLIFAVDSSRAYEPELFGTSRHIRWRSAWPRGPVGSCKLIP